MVARNSTQPPGSREQVELHLQFRPVSADLHPVAPKSPARARLALLLVLVLGGCATLGGHPGRQREPAEIGVASYYARKFNGRTTASGARFDSARMLAAHRTLPFGTRVRVTNLENRRSVVVTVVDRGPFRKGRIIDLSRAAAKELGFAHAGLATVRLDVIGP